MLPLSRGWPHFHAPTGQCWRQFCFMVELAPETTASKWPQVHPDSQGSCPLLPFPLPNPRRHRLQSHCLINKENPNLPTLIPQPPNKILLGVMLQNSSSLRLLQCSWHARGVASHLKYSRRETALLACWGPAPLGEMKVTAPVHPQKGMVCWMLQSEANRADGEECRQGNGDGWRGGEAAGGWPRAGGERKGWRTGRRVQRVMRCGMMWEIY